MYLVYSVSKMITSNSKDRLYRSNDVQLWRFQFTLIGGLLRAVKRIAKLFRRV
jgi:hypothetical protein